MNLGCCSEDTASVYGLPALPFQLHHEFYLFFQMNCCFSQLQHRHVWILSWFIYSSVSYQTYWTRRQLQTSGEPGPLLSYQKREILGITTTGEASPYCHSPARSSSYWSLSQQWWTAYYARNRCNNREATSLYLASSLSNQMNRTVVFVDFEKACHSLHQATLWKILWHCGIPQKLVNIMQEHRIPHHPQQQTDRTS